jgi:hypothetical protein
MTVRSNLSSSFANQIERSRLSDGAGQTKDMMQAHINSGMNEEELIQQVFISMCVQEALPRILH